jgi:PIN domain nuclease of toxin-antitoxin system
MILLDTHILIWLLIAPENLSPRAKKAILAARKSGPLALSAISLWEIAWLAVNKRIDIDVSVDSFVLFSSQNPTQKIPRTGSSEQPRLLRAFAF